MNTNPRAVAEKLPCEFAGLGLDGRSRVLVLGLGSTGLSTVRFLRRQGFECAVMDSRIAPPGLEELREAFPDVPLFLGEFSKDALAAATHLVVSPGLSLERDEIREARRRGVRVFGDLDLFACCARAPIAAITGANGKSTVTTLVGLMAKASGIRAAVGGNLGTPMLDLLDAAAELYVLELSSFQLERSELFEADVATVLNISPDHMDRYPDLAAYAEAKRRVFRGDGLMVLNQDDPLVAGMREPGRHAVRFGLGNAAALDYTLGLNEGKAWILAQGVPLLPADEVRIKGRHNLANALAAVAIADACKFDREAVVQVLRTFPGLDHRMQWVADIDGVAYVNDSKATNVGACIAALSGLEGKAVLIAGGDGKGADFSSLAPVAAEMLRAAVLMGRDGPLIEQVLKDVVPTIRVNTMFEAVRAARGVARRGDTVLLAPACASLDQYKDYQERGRDFAATVRTMS
ncbi:UDP-N-acetylmuramoyl-L-alanine--D-glutamate ligase [Methylococcus mesophilus]|uniref:UDP-N-acetylmuramoyl-L-alanine--D-glutamate ligase n=1 Tax=Methylococcus mesophilus TaxID=2993564 RepID=UPI00224A70C2|nr:UDP-N-acetylmuramoyl-L-alanine--D-glutamate ligase [Methylococcus mesophilus]UZR30535.1 UDP-N-acetylmuramoyl-L-alanine--D-glutamate ligase [Methylococcus mesophilus]